MTVAVADHAAPGRSPEASRATVACWRLERPVGVAVTILATAALRSACLAIEGDDPPAHISGHGDHERHVAWLAIPDTHAPTFSALAIVTPAGRRPPQIPVYITVFGRRVGLVEEIVAPEWLTATSAAWETVTPIAMPWTGGPRSWTASRRAVRASARTAGYPEAVVEASSSSCLDRSPGAYVSSRPGEPSRPTTHATIRFPRPISGPVLLGPLRYFGLGLLRPVECERL